MTMAIKSSDLVAFLSLIAQLWSAECAPTAGGQWENNEFFGISRGKPPEASAIFSTLSLISRRLRIQHGINNSSYATLKVRHG